MFTLKEKLIKLLKTLIPYPVYTQILNTSRYLTSFFYLGENYECAFCESSFSTFFPAGSNLAVLKEKQVIGGGFRENATCPRCYSVDRERLLYLFLLKEMKHIFEKRIKLLHVAPEPNLSKKLKKSKNIDYISADLDATRADIKMDITDINKPDETYDIIICNHVLEHIPDDNYAMSELFRVLKNGGFAILQVPISYKIDKTVEDTSISCSRTQEQLFGKKDHVRIYGNDYKHRLSNAGFTVSSHNFTEKLKKNEVEKYGLDEQEKIFLCKKIIN